MKTMRQMQAAAVWDTGMSKSESEPPVRVQRMVRRFRCTTSRFQLLDPPRNPFLVAIENFGEGTTTIRTYEFDAADEAECRRWFDEAKRDRLMEVEGFTLDKIEEIAPNDQAH
jgi:hypothetical protein